MIRRSLLVFTPLVLTACLFIGEGDNERQLARFDTDGDGFVAIEHGGDDCDDDNPDISPGAPETCNDVDDDCDGDVDELLEALRFEDADGDGYGDPLTGELLCGDLQGWVEDRTDCDDDDADVNPGSPETCNDVDDDCDGAVDEELDVTMWRDADGDGFGDPDAPKAGCTDLEGYASNDDDCDDEHDDAHPDGTEVCDEVDNDCDGEVDEGAADAKIWFVDMDLDGFGDPEASTSGCVLPAGYITQAGDCDDADPDIHPEAPEYRCDDVDSNCDGDTEPNDGRDLGECDSGA